MEPQLDAMPMIAFCRESIRTARIEHTCTSCKKTIHKGERYVYLVWKSAGEALMDDHECLPCHSAWP